MAITIEQFIQRIDAAIADLLTQMPAIADTISLNALAMIKNRIVDQRQGIKGFVYSTKPMLATKDQFVVKSAFRQSKVDAYQIKKDKAGKRVSSKSGRSYKTTAVKRDLWIRFDKASKAVPVMLLPNGYKEFRQIQGRQAEVVDASLSGMMWKGTTIVARVVKGHTYITILGGSNKEAADKLKWLTEKYGPFLTLMPEEQDKLDQSYNSMVQKVIDKHFKQ